MLLPPKAGGRRNGGSTAGEEHGEQLPCAGSSAVESIPIFVSTFPFAGGRSGGDLGRLKLGNEGSLQPFVRLRVGDHGMLEQLRRRGTFQPPRHAAFACEARGGSFAPKWLGPRQLVVIVSTCCRRNREWVRSVARKRRSEER